MSPIDYVWQGGAWHPLPYYRKQAEQFGEGEVARLERIEHRSQASHNEFFAQIHDIFTHHLPEAYQSRWPTSDDFRHWLLTFTPHCAREEFFCPSRAEAARWMTNLAKKYHRIQIEGPTLIGYIAKSQSKKSMKAREFQASKEAVYAACAQIIGVDTETLKREAGTAA